MILSSDWSLTDTSHHSYSRYKVTQVYALGGLFVLSLLLSTFFAGPRTLVSIPILCPTLSVPHCLTGGLTCVGCASQAPLPAGFQTGLASEKLWPLVEQKSQGTYPPSFLPPVLAAFPCDSTFCQPVTLAPPGTGDIASFPGSPHPLLLLISWQLRTYK